LIARFLLWTALLVVVLGVNLYGRFVDRFWMIFGIMMALYGAFWLVRLIWVRPEVLSFQRCTKAVVAGGTAGTGISAYASSADYQAWCHENNLPPYPFGQPDWAANANMRLPRSFTAVRGLKAMPWPGGELIQVADQVVALSRPPPRLKDGR
jgi:hypothetical protein